MFSNASCPSSHDAYCCWNCNTQNTRNIWPLLICIYINKRDAVMRLLFCSPFCFSFCSKFLFLKQFHISDFKYIFTLVVVRFWLHSFNVVRQLVKQNTNYETASAQKYKNKNSIKKTQKNNKTKVWKYESKYDFCFVNIVVFVIVVVVLNMRITTRNANNETTRRKRMDCKKKNKKEGKIEKQK